MSSLHLFCLLVLFFIPESCVDQIPLYGDLYVGHPPPTPPPHTLEDWHCLIPSKSLSADPLSSFASFPS